jgi:hypothetical protein
MAQDWCRRISPPAEPRAVASVHPRDPPLDRAVLRAASPPVRPMPRFRGPDPGGRSATAPLAALAATK